MRVAVIGHGPSAEGAGLGSVIDGCDLVVKMHDCHWQTAEDWGRRWDFGVLPGPWSGRWERTRQSSPTSGWWAYRLQKTDRIPTELAGLLVVSATLKWTIPKLRRKGMGRVAPTRGLCGALMALQFASPTELVMVGFDRLRDGCMQGQPYTLAQANCDPGYRAENQIHVSGPICGPHHFGAERALLAESAEAAGCRITHLP